MNDFDYLYLGKWCRLLVQGQPITKAQAAEIIVRTWSGLVFCNDKSIQRRLLRIMGVNPGPHGFGDAAEPESAHKRYNLLELNHLFNSRIVSSWIGGPHGWVDWSGEVGCSNYNVKWPTAEAVYEDWCTIAEAFPYLNLQAQLVLDEGNGPAAVQFDVANGRVVHFDPKGKLLRPPTELAPATMLSVALLPPRIRELGCSYQQFEEALKLAEQAAQPPRVQEPEDVEPILRFSLLELD